MQTFLPFPDFNESAKALDYRRLGKQRVEAFQIINTLENKSKGWKNHPATLMWKDNIEALKYYCNCMILEWIRRGYKNTMKLYDVNINDNFSLPEFIGLEEFHRSHRQALLFKNYEFYKDIFPNDIPCYDYYWHTKHKNKEAIEIK